MLRQLHGENIKTQGTEACTDLPETQHHGLGVRDMPSRAVHRALCTVCCVQTATRESPYTENGTGAGSARAETIPAAAGSEALPAAFTLLVLLCLGARGFFGCYHKGDLSIWSDAVT